MNVDELKSEVDRQIETVFKVEEPLQKIEDGYGYTGVLLRDTLSDTLQCHICGVWKKSLSTHCNQAHKISSQEYKYKYGLPLTFPLVARSTSAKHSARMRNPDTYKKMAEKRNPKKASRSRKRKIFNYFKSNSAHDNKHGLCQEQILRRYMCVSDIIGKEPGLKDLIKYDNSLWAGIRRRWKTVNNFRKNNGFEIVKKSPCQTDDKLISFLRKFYEEHGKIPKSKYFRKGNPCSATILNHFGSWHRALISAGFNVLS